jgi:hypothetical protein
MSCGRTALERDQIGEMALDHFAARREAARERVETACRNFGETPEPPPPVPQQDNDHTFIPPDAPEYHDTTNRYGEDKTIRPRESDV